MNQVLLFPEVFLYLGLSVLILLILLFQLPSILQTIDRWDFAKTTQSQLQLESKSVFLSLLLRTITAIKLLLVPLLFYAAQELSEHLPGAMCAAGVFNANSWGLPVILLSLLNLSALIYLIVIDHEDFSSPSYPYSPFKHKVLFFVTQALFVEALVSFTFFSNIHLQSVVQCCSSLFSSSLLTSSGPLTPLEYLVTVIFLYLFSIVLESQRFFTLSLIVNILFAYMGILSIIYLYSPYIYELPTHRCPYCFFQREYYYSGYLIYFFFYFGILSGVLLSCFSIFHKQYIPLFRRYSTYFKGAFLLLINIYVFLYFYKNGTWLMAWY